MNDKQRKAMFAKKGQHGKRPVAVKTRRADSAKTTDPGFQRSFSSEASAKDYARNCRIKGFQAEVVHVTGSPAKNKYRVFARRSKA